MPWAEYLEKAELTEVCIDTRHQVTRRTEQTDALGVSTYPARSGIGSTLGDYNQILEQAPVGDGTVVRRRNFAHKR